LIAIMLVSEPEKNALQSSNTSKMRNSVLRDMWSKTGKS
jgi:hypothetical protein